MPNRRKRGAETHATRRIGLDWIGEREGEGFFFLGAMEMCGRVGCGDGWWVGEKVWGCVGFEVTKRLYELDLDALRTKRNEKETLIKNSSTFPPRKLRLL